RVDHLLADLNQLAADGQVVDGAAVILGIDDGGGVGRQSPEILRDGQFAHRRIGLEEGLQRDRRRALAAQDQLRDRFIDACVQRIVEMPGLEEGRDTVDRLVVDEDRAEQGLFGLQVMRRLAKHRGFRLQRANQCIAHGPTLPQTRLRASRRVCGQRGEPALAHREHRAHRAGYASAASSSASPSPAISAGAPSSNSASAATLAASASSSASVIASVTSSPRAWRAASSAERATLTAICGCTSACSATRMSCKPSVLIGRSSITWRRSMEKPPSVTAAAMSRVETEPERWPLSPGLRVIANMSQLS